MILNPPPPIRALSNPRLIDVEPRRILDLYRLAVLRLNLSRGHDLAVLRAKSHTAARDSVIPRLFQLILDLPGQLFLAVAHLRDGVVDSLAYDLMRQMDQLLCARRENRAGAPELLLGELDVLLLGQLAVGADHLHDLPPLISHPPPGVGVKGVLHVFLHLAVVEGRRGGFLPRLFGALDLLVEDGRALGAARETLGEFVLLLSFCHLLGERGVVACVLLGEAGERPPGISTLCSGEEVLEV